MEFYNDSKSADAFKTLQSLLKYNNGIFKSQKQANFIMSGALIDIWSKRDPIKKMNEDEIARAKHYDEPLFLQDETTEEARKRMVKEADSFFNIPLQDGQHLISIEGMIDWAGYGRNGKRRVGFMYVLDNNGVVARYKMHYTYNKGGCSQINRDRTEMDWKRPSYAELPNYVSLEVAKEQKKKEEEAALEGQAYVGIVGQRLVFEGTVVKIIDMGTGTYGYNGVYLKEWSFVKTAEGHTVVVHKRIADEGQTVKFKATVESHGAYKGVKQTHVTRVSVL